MTKESACVLNEDDERALPIPCGVSCVFAYMCVFRYICTHGILCEKENFKQLSKTGIIIMMNFHQI